MPDEEPIRVSLKCTKRGCGGDIEVSDPGEICDGQEGRCECGRVYVATSFENGTMEMVYDRAPTDRERRMFKK